MKAQEEQSSKMLPCSHCSKEFRYNSERKRHELSHFPRFECETCSKKFSFVSALRRHQKQHERTESVKCDKCNRKFRDDVLLKRHIKYAHKGTFICEKCDSKFSSDLALSIHMKTHKPESERRFKCSHGGCTKSFNFSHHLKHHELTHTNAKQHYCNICGKGFIQSHHLKTHLKSHDPAVWLICESPGCKKKFSTDYTRKRHMVTHKCRPDSGISSDSNSCDRSITFNNNTEDSLCATCGETVSNNEYKTHTTLCSKSEESYIRVASIDKEDVDNIVEWPNSPFKPNVLNEDSLKPIIEGQIGDCNMLKGCIVKKDKCVCTQITSVTGNCEFIPIESIHVNSFENDNENVVMFSNNITTNADLQYTENINAHAKPVIVQVSPNDYDHNNHDMCAGCDCANICNNKISMYLMPEDLSTKYELPKIVEKDTIAPCIEYRTDGVIKIKDTFDDGIVLKSKNDYSKRFIPFSTCKDVVGNCLVSGGDGCLCAKMMADEDEAIMAQEIDDITPHPKTEI